MKKLAIITTLLLSSFTLELCAINTRTFSNGIEYNDYIVNEQSEIGDLISTMMLIVNDTNSTFDQAEQARKTLERRTMLAVENIEEMPAWKGNVAFRDAALDLFKFYHTCFSVDYKRMIVIIYKNEASNEELDELDAILADISEREGPKDEKFLNEQNKFAEDNDFTITPTEE